MSLIGRIAKTHPFKFGCVFSCAKTSFSDWLVQTQIEKVCWHNFAAWACLQPNTPPSRITNVRSAST